MAWILAQSRLLIYRQSGLLGVSGVSSNDIRTLKASSGTPSGQGNRTVHIPGPREKGNPLVRSQRRWVAWTP